MPAMRPNWRSSGVATAEAMVSGLAPGSDAPTEMTGKSICGSGETGSCMYARAPASNNATVSSVVAIGRSMAGLEMFISVPEGFRRLVRAHATESFAQAIEPQINHRRGVEGQQLADQQSADDGDTERAPQLRSGAAAERQRNGAEQRCKGGHHDGAEAQQARFIDGIHRLLAFAAFGFQGEVDHHD